jgi:hypothetical protein
MQKPFVIHPRFETFPAELNSLWRSSSRASGGNVNVKVTPPPSRAGTPAGIFIPAELRRLFTVWKFRSITENRDLGETTAGGPDR